MSNFTAAKSLMQSIQNNWNVYQTALAHNPNGVCGTNTTPPASMQALENALNGCVQIVPMLKGFGGYAASYAQQLADAIPAANVQSKTVAGSYDICVNPGYGSAVGAAVNWASAAYNSLLQQVQQAQAASLASLAITTSGFGGNLTVAVLGWQYSARPVPAQVQGMFAGTQTLSSSLKVYSVKDTGQNDSLGNPLYVAYVAAVGGTFSGQPASKAGENGAGYDTVLCGSTQWCLGIQSYAPVGSIGPVHTQPQPPSGGYRVPVGPVGNKVGVHLTGGLQGNTGVNAPFALQQGHRIATSTQASGGLPADFQNQTVQTVQAQVNAAGVAANVVSVKYSPDGTTLYVEEDHCGPTNMTSNPFTVTDAGVTITTTYTDMGSASTCSASSGMSTKAKVGIAAAVVALGVGAWWVLS